MDSDVEEDVPDDYYYYNGQDSSDEDEDDDDGVGVGGWDGTYCGFRPSFLYPCYSNLPTPTVITQEEADKNAQELLEQEKKEKEKANKKRLKKKRQKERKRQHKLLESLNNGNISPENQVLGPNGTDEPPALADEGSERKDKSEPDSEEDLDFGSTFVRQAKKKIERKPKPERKARASERSQDHVSERSQDRVSERSQDRASERSQDRASERSQDRASERSQDRASERPQDRASERPQDRPSERSQDRGSEGCQDRGSERDVALVKEPVRSPKLVQEKAQCVDEYHAQQSMHFANIGNNFASGEKFVEAIACYSDAIKLNPTEYRFFGNRSYSYERSGRYSEALQDAERALQLEPRFIRGYFRKGKALKGLKRYADAIAAFHNVLYYDINHPEAASEIDNCQQIIQATSSFTRVKIIPNSPLSPPLTPIGSLPGPDKGFVPRTVVYTRAGLNNNPPKLKNSYNPAKPLAAQNPHPPISSKLYPIWVGNVTNEITERVLRSHFEPFGAVHSMRILYSRTCAFINFTNKESAERAFHALQGLSIEGTTFVLQLRNPEHLTVTSGKTQ
ncbi:tetratricopeptide repeat protein 31 isoform X2 [Xenopus laevis]|nr:tetratricopeptide repeat protein 31 isoform X2 [Xenopus laevis]OCT57329.1 hypothetical protein XELAEV_18003708mg [Xenopus laevis]